MRTTPPTDSPYLTKEQAAHFLCCSPRKIDYLRASGELRAFRPGRTLLFSRDDLDAYVRRHVEQRDLDMLIDDTLAELRDESQARRKAGRGDGQHAR